MRRRRRSRSRGSGPSLLSAALLLGVALLVVTAGTPAIAFSSASLDRGGTTAVTDDADGLIGLDVAGSVRAGSSSRLVTVTNQQDRTVDVTVIPENASVTLSNAQATLAPGESLTTSASVSCDAAPDSVSATVTAVSGSQFSGTATRSTAVDTADCSSNSSPFSAVSGSASAGSFSGPSGGPTGSVEFAIENTGPTARTITAFELIEAGTATALSADRPKPLNVQQGKDEVYIDARGGSTSSEGAAEDAETGAVFRVGDGTSHTLDQPVTVDAGESAQLFLYQFAENGTPYTFQNGDSLTLSLTLQDGTQATVTETV